MSGATYRPAQQDEPRFVPTILSDKASALHAVYGMLAALVAQSRGREEAIHVQVPMFETMAAFVLNEHLAGATFKENGQVGYPRVLSAHRRPHRARDGWIAVLPYTAAHWQRFLAEAGRAEICSEPWFNDPHARQERIEYLYSLSHSSCLSAPRPSGSRSSRSSTFHARRSIASTTCCTIRIFRP